MDFPKAFVMDWIDTDDRAPGMLHTAIDMLAGVLAYRVLRGAEDGGAAERAEAAGGPQDDPRP